MYSTSSAWQIWFGVSISIQVKQYEAWTRLKYKMSIGSMFIFCLRENIRITKPRKRTYRVRRNAGLECFHVNYIRNLLVSSVDKLVVRNANA